MWMTVSLNGIMGKRRMLCFFVEELPVIGIHFDKNVVNS